MRNEVSFFEFEFLQYSYLWAFAAREQEKLSQRVEKTHSVNSEIHKHEVRDLSGRWRRKKAKGQEEESECECEQGRER